MGQPTTEPVEERIMANVETVLEAIRTEDATTSYWNDIFEVLRNGAGYPSLNDYPTCVLTIVNNDVEDDRDSNTYSLNAETLRLEIDGWINEAADTQRELIRFARDIRTALMLDPSRGSLAHHTFIEGCRYFPSEDANSPVSALTLSVRVFFSTRVDALETAVI